MATKTAKKTTAKKETMDNITKIQKTAESVGTQVKATAEVVLDDMKKNTGKLRDAATKVDMKKSVEKIQKTATSVNKEVVATATEVAKDVIENGRQIANVAIQTAKDTINKIDLNEGVERVRGAVKTANEYGLKTADSMLDNALENGEKWQNVANKAVKGGLQLAERQQDMMFKTLEVVKGQFVKGVKRTRALFSAN